MEKHKNVVQLMVKYAILFFVVILISFVLPRMIPGSPLYTLMGEGGGYADEVPSAVLGQFEEYYAPDLPLHEQFFRYLFNLAHLDLGQSFFYKSPVIERILGAARWTLQLSLTSFVISSVLGILLGVNMGMMKKNKGTILVPPLLILQAVPTFLLAAIAQMILAYKLQIFPATGAVTPGMYEGQEGYMLDVLTHMILPLLILIITEIPSTAMFAYTSTIRVRQAPYVKFAHYLGVEKNQIRMRYIVKNIMPEMLGKLNIQMIMCVMGAMFVEAVFSYPGLGQLLKDATNYRDYPMMQGILLISCLYGVAVNLGFEILLAKNTKVS